MQKRLFYLAIFLLPLLIGCEQNSLWVGNKEFLTIEYSNDQFLGPYVSPTAIDQSPFIDYGNIYAQNVGGGSVQITVDGVRVQSNSNNFEINKISIYEKDDDKFEIQDEFTTTTTDNKTDLASVLVLDMSTSLEDLVPDLKEYAKSFVDEVVNSTPNSKVAVVFFSGRSDIYTTPFYDQSNANFLKQEIDDFSNYQSRTALFEATKVGLNMLDNLTFSGSKALVVFTDGGDNDSNNPDDLRNEIEDSEYMRICIGLKGEDFDKDDMDVIADSKSNSIVVKKEENLQKVFDEVARQVVSVYSVVYERSDQLLDNSIDIKFEFEVDKIK